MTAIQNLSAPLGRLLLSLIFVVSGVGKIGAYAGTQAYMDSMGVPGVLLPLPCHRLVRQRTLPEEASIATVSPRGLFPFCTQRCSGAPNVKYIVRPSEVMCSSPTS